MACDLDDCEFMLVLAVARDRAPFFKHSIVCKIQKIINYKTASPPINYPAIEVTPGIYELL
jgi:hypothetical protein